MTRTAHQRLFRVNCHAGPVVSGSKVKVRPATKALVGVRELRHKVGLDVFPLRAFMNSTVCEQHCCLVASSSSAVDVSLPERALVCNPNVQCFSIPDIQGLGHAQANRNFGLMLAASLADVGVCYAYPSLAELAVAKAYVPCVALMLCRLIASLNHARTSRIRN